MSTPEPPTATTAAAPLTPGRGTVTMETERCKGCELCVLACPPQVLSMSHDVNEAGYRYPVLADGCIGCSLCHAVCPDFVFEVYRFPQTPGSQVHP